MHSLEIIAATNGVLAAAVGAFSFWKFPKNIVNRAFTFLSFAVAIWATAQFLPISSEFSELIIFGAATLAAAANLHFTINLIGRLEKQPLILSVIYLASIMLFSVFALDRFNVFSIFASDAIWFAGFLVMLVLPIFLVARSIGKFSGIKKYQLRFVLVEYILAIVLVTGKLTLLWNFEESFIENIILTPHFLSGLHLIAVFYFFVQWKFLKLKIIAPKILKRLVALMITVTIVSLLNYFEFDHHEVLIIPLTIIIAVLFYTLILRFFEKINLFTTISLNNFKKVVEEFKNQNIFYASIEELEENIRLNFSRKVGIEETKVTVLDLDSETSKFPELEKYFAKKSRYLVTAEEEYLSKNKNIDCPYLSELESLGDVCFPLFQNTNELIGFFSIRHTGDDIYIEEELKLLEGGVHYIALSLMAILYTEKLRQQAEKLREDYEKLKTLDDAKDAFIANVSHELRTPATAIKGYAEMLSAPNFGELSEKQKDFTNRITKNTNWLLALLGDILEITKLESGNIHFQLERTNVHAVLEPLAKRWQKLCTEKGLTFEFETAQEVPTEIVTDSAKLSEIIERLLGNAHKFTEKGSVKLVVNTYEKFLKIEVVDTGIGIPAEKIERMWDKFSQSADILGKGDESSGLGLAIVKKLVENLNGKVSAKSEIEKGSTFTLLIPLQHE